MARIMNCNKRRAVSDSSGLWSAVSSSRMHTSSALRWRSSSGDRASTDALSVAPRDFTYTSESGAVSDDEKSSVDMTSN